MYNDPQCKPWTSRSWAPPGYTDRRDLVEKTRAAEEAHRSSFAAGGEEIPVDKATRRSSATGSATYNEHDRSAAPVGLNEKV